MSNFLAPSTSLALLQATEGDSKKSLAELKKQRNLEKVDQAAQEFEAVFMSEMMKPMFETIEVDSLFGGGKGEEIFRDFLVQEYGKIMSRTGSVGIADQVKTAMLKMQEEADSHSQGSPTPPPISETPNLIQGDLSDE